MNLLIIQARMASTRLPGKILMQINHQSLLENLIERISESKLIDNFIIATTTNSEDDAIQSLCIEKNWNFFRGDSLDVLSRFYYASKQFENVKNIIRITSDCPLHHHQVIDFAIEQFNKFNVEYFSNSNHEPNYLEDGFDTEVFTFNSLSIAYTQAKKPSEREHVTPFIKNSGMFTCAWKKYNDDYQHKLSVDNLDDFHAVQRIFQELKSTHDFGINEVTALLQQKPEILEINKESIINEGYQRSLSNDNINT